MDDRPVDVDVEVAARLLARLRTFASGLEPGERRVLAALLAPGVDAAWAAEPDVSEPDDSEPDVVGFAWRPDDLMVHLAGAVRREGIRIEGW